MRFRSNAVLSGFLALSFTAACGGGGDDDGDDGVFPPEPPVDVDPADEGCPAMFGQHLLPHYEIEISDAEWSALEDEFENRAQRAEDMLDINPYHPITFRYDGEEVTDAMIRLKGNTSWVQAVEFDDNPKMQFVISFNENDKEGRFRGVRKIELDMPRSDYSFLRQRLALRYLRSIGEEAQCANNARLVINGEYYGLYTNLERLDKEFLQRYFGDQDDGDLWKGGRVITTNEETFSYARLEPFWDAYDLAAVQAAGVDLETSIAAWAAEAMIPHSDGYYMGRPNFFLYDHPTRGFMWLNHDLDSAYDYLLPDISPLYGECDEVEAYKCGGRLENERQHWAVVMGDPDLQEQYVDELRTARAGYDADDLSDRVGEWAAQIAVSVERDDMKPFGQGDHDLGVETLQAYPAKRAEAIDAWLACRDSGEGADADGDGYVFCDDCDDKDDTQYPGAPEAANMLDDDCDFLVDEADAPMP